MYSWETLRLSDVLEHSLEFHSELRKLFVTQAKARFNASIERDVVF